MFTSAKTCCDLSNGASPQQALLYELPVSTIPLMSTDNYGADEEIYHQVSEAVYTLANISTEANNAKVILHTSAKYLLCAIFDIDNH